MHPEKQLERTQRQRVGSACPVKQARAVLKSTPPRDNWIEGDEIKTSPSLGRPKPPQDSIWRPLFQSLVMPQKNLGVGACAPGANQPKKLAKTPLANVRFFEASASFYSGLLRICAVLVTVRYRGQTKQKRTANTFSLGLVRFTSDDLGLPRIIGTARWHGCPPCPSRAAVPKRGGVRLVVTGQGRGGG